MSRVLYGTGSALLDFDRKEVMERLSSLKGRHGADITAELLRFLSSPWTWLGSSSNPGAVSNSHTLL